MLDNYGVIIYWDVKNNCFVASSSDLIYCQATGSTKAEALEAVEIEMEAWASTARNLSYNSPQQETIQFDPIEISNTILNPIEPNSFQFKPGTRHIFAPASADVEYTRNYSLVRLKGEVDISCANEFKWLLQDTVEAEKTNIIIDLTELVHMDSSGYGTLLNVMRRLSKIEKRLTIANPPKGVTRLLQITRLNSVFLVFESVEDAIESQLFAIP